MRKTLLLLLLVLTGCQAVNPVTEDFEYDANCPDMCWLGINPGVTTAERAASFFKSSSRFDQDSIKISEAGLSVSEVRKDQTSAHVVCYLKFDRGLVKSMSLGGYPYSIDSFVKVLGQPDEISPSLENLERTVDFYYLVYYSKQKIILQIYPALDMSGPQPGDPVFALYLNDDGSEDSHPIDWQPWQGYGHIQDYFPGTEIPPTYPPGSGSSGNIPVP